VLGYNQMREQRKERTTRKSLLRQREKNEWEKYAVDEK
jgi:hypothetical protein